MLNDLELKNDDKLPSYFKPIMWSYDFELLDLQMNKKRIIINTINYGDLRHWRWISQFYGKEEIRQILTEITATEIRPRALNLASIIFNVDKFNYALRGLR
jgi:hypothetical protein